MLERDRRARQVIENRFEAIVKQRQPVLHAGVATAFAYRLIEQVVWRGRAKFGDIAGAKTANRLGDKLELGDRHKVEPPQLLLAALGLRVETLDRLQCI